MTTALVFLTSLIDKIFPRIDLYMWLMYFTPNMFQLIWTIVVLVFIVHLVKHCVSAAVFYSNMETWLRRKKTECSVRAFSDTVTNEDAQAVMSKIDDEIRLSESRKLKIQELESKIRSLTEQLVNSEKKN